LQHNIIKVTFVMLSALCVFIGSLLWSQPTSATGGNGKKNDQIHVHIKGGSQYVTSVAVVYKGQTLILDEKNPKLWSIIQPGDIVKPDISEIIVTRTDGSKQVFSPASNYAGVEGKGTINYWITVDEPKKSDSDTTGTGQNNNNDDHSTTDKNHNNNTTTTTPKTTDTSSNTTHTTVNGGKLPVTATPWYNLIALGMLTAFFSGLFLLRLKRHPL
jgi:hypothetical protein